MIFAIMPLFCENVSPSFIGKNLRIWAGRKGACPKLGWVKSSKDKLYAEVAMHGFVFFLKVRSSIMLDRYLSTST